MPLAFDKRRGRSFNCKISSFLSASLNIKQFTINMHSNKVLRKHDMHDMQHNSRHEICMICKLMGDTWIT